MELINALAGNMLETTCSSKCCGGTHVLMNVSNNAVVISILAVNAVRRICHSSTLLGEKTVASKINLIVLYTGFPVFAHNSVVAFEKKPTSVPSRLSGVSPELSSKEHQCWSSWTVVFLSCPLVKKHAYLLGSFLYSQLTMKEMYSKPTNRTELSIPIKIKSLA